MQYDAGMMVLFRSFETSIQISMTLVAITELLNVIIQLCESKKYLPYHFYHSYSGLPKEQKDLYGLMSAEKYFYLNQVIIFTTLKEI